MKIFYRRRIIDEMNNPQLWSLPFNDTEYLQFISQNLSLVPGLKKALELFTSDRVNSKLLISARYTYSMKFGFPAYFSHRERLILSLNKLRIYNDIEDFKRWALYEDNTEKSFYYSISIMIWSLNQAILKNKSSDEFRKIILELRNVNPLHAGNIGSILKNFFLGLCHYLINEYQDAMKYIKPIKSYKGPAALFQVIHCRLSLSEAYVSSIDSEQRFQWAV